MFSHDAAHKIQECKMSAEVHVFTECVHYLTPYIFNKFKLRLLFNKQEIDLPLSIAEE